MPLVDTIMAQLSSSWFSGSESHTTGTGGGSVGGGRDTEKDREYNKLNLYRGIGSDKIVRSIPAN